VGKGVAGDGQLQAYDTNQGGICPLWRELQVPAAAALTCLKLQNAIKPRANLGINPCGWDRICLRRYETYVIGKVRRMVNIAAPLTPGRDHSATGTSS
jgi:hypothetical protein